MCKDKKKYICNHIHKQNVEKKKITTNDNFSPGEVTPMK